MSGLHPGAVVDARYEVLEQIQSHGDVAMFAAHDTRLQRPVQLLARDGAPDEDGLVARLRSLGGLEHPSQPTIQQVGIDDGVVFVVVDAPRGETLQQRVHDGELDTMALIGIFARISDLVAVLHEGGFVLGPFAAADVRVRSDDVVTLGPLAAACLMDGAGSGWTPPDDVAAVGSVLANLLGERRGAGLSALLGTPRDAAALRDGLAEHGDKRAKPRLVPALLIGAAVLVASLGVAVRGAGEPEPEPDDPVAQAPDDAHQLAFLGQTLEARRTRGKRVRRADGPDIEGTWVQDGDSRAVAWFAAGQGEAWRWCQSNAKKGAPPSKNRFYHCGELDLIAENGNLFLIGLVYDLPGYDGGHEILLEFEVFSADAMTLNASLFRMPGEDFRFAFFDHKFVRSDVAR